MQSGPADDHEQPLPTTLLGQLLRQTPRYGLGLLLLAVYQGGQYWFDTRLSVAIDKTLAGDTAEGTRIGIWLVIVAVSLLGVRVASRVAVFNAGRMAEYELRRALLHKLQQLGPAFYGTMSTGEIMSRSTNDLGQVRMLFGFGLLNAFNTVLALASALAVTFAISTKLTFAALSTLPLLFLAMTVFARKMFALQRQNQDSLGGLSSLVQAGISGVRVVRSFGLEQRELARFAEANKDYLDKTLRLSLLRVVMFPVVQAITALGTIIVLWYGGLLVLEEQITAGGLLAFIRALGRLTWPLMSLGFLASMIQRGRASFTRVAEVFTVEPEIVDGPLPAPAAVRGALAVRDLRFAYGDHEVLDGVSFDVAPGQLVAGVGRTGSGKSTLAALLPRLQPTPRGSVFLDGQDVCDLPLRVVRGTIGYAQQTAFLFSTTVGRNIAFCLEDPDGDEALRAVRRGAAEAQIDAEVEHLPDGYDTIVGERGVQLSGGQKQRVALARALLAEPRVLVLDDPLSAVDARTERAILDAIETQRSRRSVILITHRVAAAARCDAIVVLDRGRVVETGTHEQLRARGGLYATFAEEQRIETELQKLAGEPEPMPEGAPA